MSNALRILLLVLTLPALLVAQDPPVIKTFGELAEDGSYPAGSFRVGFSKDTAGIVWLQATDHYHSLEAANNEERQTSDYLLLVDNGNHALRLFQAEGGVFAKSPADSPWQMADIEDGVKFTLADGNGLILEKEFVWNQQARGFDVTLRLTNENSDAVGNQEFYVGGPALVSPKMASLFGDVSVAIAAPIGDGETKVLKPSPEGLRQQFEEFNPKALSFAGSTNRFFGAFFYPKDDASRDALTNMSVETVLPPANVEQNSSTRVVYGLQMAVPQKTQSSQLHYGVYFGPKSYRVFETLPEPERFAPILDNDLNPPCCGGISIPGGKQMAVLLLGLLGFFHDILGNWGFAIILLTVLVRGAMFPLNFRMQKSMRAFGAKMAKLKPKMDAMKKQYADDQKAYQQAMIAFNREHKVMPPIGGCLPIFLTMPIYLGLFTALRTAYDLRQQPFMSWIDDLSTSDALFSLGFWPDDFNLLPLLWIALFVTMTLRQPLPTDPQQRQMQMIMRFMPIMFGVMLYTYASALLLYMVTSMLWSLIESSIVKKILGPADPSAGMMPTPM